ncbi:thiamine-binding protein [Cohnella sp. GbtcB17]|uniref:thiamine-binding protein n=1 Tax=Cohnella sp. GbtcB17 TaxID=2824762 RepID=UPI001C2F6007|nr:thiamine-binding protein [Cohnella sp. GbtcB17]
MAQALLSIQILPKAAKPEDDTHLYVDRAIEIIKASGVAYRVGPLETTMEGDLDQLLDIVKEMNQAMFEKGSPSVLSQIKLLVHGSDGASMAHLLRKYPDGQ